MRILPAIILLLSLFINCQSVNINEDYDPWNSAEPKNASESLEYLLKKSKARVIIDGVPFILDAGFWVNLMPGNNMRGGLMANVEIKDARIKGSDKSSSSLPVIESDCLWLIHRYEIMWKTSYRNEMEPENSNYGGVARGGPPITAKNLTAIVRIKYRKKTYYLKQTDIEVMSVM